MFLIYNTYRLLILNAGMLIVLFLQCKSPRIHPKMCLHGIRLCSFHESSELKQNHETIFDSGGSIFFGVGGYKNQLISF